MRKQHDIGIRNALRSALVLAAVLLTSACGNNDSQKAQDVYAKQEANAAANAIEPESATKSLVVLGDSVAAGEGIEYGYKYNRESLLGARWVGGISDPIWQGQYQLCHQSGQAYGDVIAHDLNMNLAKFACTGATYENGLTGPRTSQGTVYRPAEFGNWQTQTDLNSEYDAAAPDTVIVTLGADDIDFVGIVTYCVLGFISDDMDRLEQDLQTSGDYRRALRNELKRHYPTIEAFLGHKDARRRSASICTADNPGKTIEKLFWEPINNGTIAQHYTDLINAIKARGAKNGKVPKIVFTTYHNPLPTPQDSIDCHDTLDLNRENLNYLNTLLIKLNDTIRGTVADVDGVSIADISQSMDGHRWCSGDPKTFGLSVLWLDFKSQAPFHPTAAGQKAIADIVKTKLK